MALLLEIKAPGGFIRDEIRVEVTSLGVYVTTGVGDQSCMVKLYQSEATSVARAILFGVAKVRESDDRDR